MEAAERKVREHYGLIASSEETAGTETLRRGVLQRGLLQHRGMMRRLRQQKKIS